MKHNYFQKATFLYLYFLLFSTQGMAQAKLVLNGAKINLANNSYLVLQNPASDAIIRHSGHIISESENSNVKWKTGNSAGSYLLPWGMGNSEYLPLSFTKSAGSGNGYYLFSTYRTGWQNSKNLPEGITNLSGKSIDNSSFVLDRFWRIEPKDYGAVPTLSNLSFAYSENELNAPGNTITESSLGLQAWNEDLKDWSDFQQIGTINEETNLLTVSSLPSGEVHKWWVLVDKASPLPLDFISFKIRQKDKDVQLDWITANEIDCKDFEIQRSSDGHSFFTIGRKNAQNRNYNTYSYTDNMPLKGISYYRLKQNDNNGMFKYTPIRSVSIEVQSRVIVYPNPASDHRLFVNMGDFPSGNYTFALFDQQGRLVYAVEKGVNKEIFQLEFPEAIKPGIYLFRINNPIFSTQHKVMFQ